MNRIAALVLSIVVLLVPGLAVAQAAPDPARMRAVVEALVGFGTRHSLSSTTDPKRGIGAARAWAMAQLAHISDTCGGCIVSANIAGTFTGPRAPNGVEIVDVLGFQQGEEPKRVVIVGAHIDSMRSDVMDSSGDAPGANDDGSGVAVVLEAARILSKEHFKATIVYALFSGEEQGLYGGTLLAQTAKQRGWTVSAMLNDDIVGSTLGKNGVRVTDRVRVFSEGIRASEDAKAALARRRDGGEDDGPSRALAKAIDHVAQAIPGGLDVFVERRPDRLGRGGDHEPFLAAGYPAVRFTVGAENWNWQHQDVRTEGGVAYGDVVGNMDFDYLAKVAAINIATVRRLARAPAAPDGVTVDGALSQTSRLAWQPVPGAAGYRVHWRRTDAQDWQQSRDVTATELVLPNVPVDDSFFGVATLAADGSESLVSFAGPPARRAAPAAGSPATSAPHSP